MKKVINNNIVFIKYILSAGICFAIDLIMFTIFNLIFKNRITYSIMLATVMARIISSSVNYLLNKNKVFGYNDDKKVDTKTFLQYGLLVIIQMLVSSVAVTYIYNRTLFNESLIKISVDSVIFLVNFFVQKKFIFNNKEKKNNVKSSLVLLVYGIITAISFIVNPVLTVEPLKIDIRNHVLILTILSIFLYYFYKKYYNVVKREKLFSLISSIFFFIINIWI